MSDMGAQLWPPPLTLAPDGPESRPTRPQTSTGTRADLAALGQVSRAYYRG
jgi:hypothetical protein